MRANMIKLIVLITFCATTFAAKYNCSTRSAFLLQRKPTYDFSVKLLDRVCQETDRNFVFSPISTYMQLLAIAEGARGNTFKEIRKVIRHHRQQCFRRKWKMIWHKVEADSGMSTKRKSLIVLDRMIRPRKEFIEEIKMIGTVSVVEVPFNDPVAAASIANKAIRDGTNGVIEDTFSPYDFNYTVLLSADTSYYKSDWQVPFNPVYTKREDFHTESSIRVVNMMNRIDYFNIADIAAIRARVLELPCGIRNKVSMLVFLPYGDVGEVFYDLRKIRLMSIFNTFRSQSKLLVNVKLPRFKIRSEVDNIAELLYDMGVKSLFNPNSANLSGISKYKVYASLMTQVADIEVDEKGVRGKVEVSQLVADRSAIDFIADRPFAYMLVDKNTEFILFAGVYSSPNLY